MFDHIQCLPNVFVDYRILTTVAKVSEIQMFVNPMFKSE